MYPSLPTTASESPHPIALLPIGNPVDHETPLSRDSQNVDGPPALAVHAFAMSTPCGPTAIPGSLYDDTAGDFTGSLVIRQPVPSDWAAATPAYAQASASTTAL